jgi:integrase
MERMVLEIDTAAKRARLPVRKNPYWRGVAGGRGGVSLGYRRTGRRGGAWIAKIAVDGQRAEERVGLADDADASSDAISYRAAVALALAWSEQQYAALEARRTAGATGRGPTVRLAVEAYIKMRIARTNTGGLNAAGQLKRYVLSDAEFSAVRLSKLRADTIEAWRERLPIRGDNTVASTVLAAPTAGGGISASTVNRLLNDLRAALYAAVEKHRRELPAHVAIEIRVGTKALSTKTQARQQVLPDAQVHNLVDSAFEIDSSGDFGRLVLLLAATGARYSQVTSLTVGDIQVESARVMMPASRKGRGSRSKPPISIPLASEVIQKLRPALEGRALHEPLLLRWQHRKTGAVTWVRDVRREWGAPFEAKRKWVATVKYAGSAPNTVMYALRHSSIVRGLRAMLPIRLVAALHDTSVEMIEKHYAAFIVDVTEDLARRATMSFASLPVAA